MSHISPEGHSQGQPATEIDLLELCVPGGHGVVSPWQPGASGRFEKGVNKGLYWSHVLQITSYKLHTQPRYF